MIALLSWLMQINGVMQLVACVAENVLDLAAGLLVYTTIGSNWMAPFLWILLTKGSVIIHIFWDNYQIPLFGAVIRL